MYLFQNVSLRGSCKMRVCCCGNVHFSAEWVGVWDTKVNQRGNSMRKSRDFKVQVKNVKVTLIDAKWVQQKVENLTWILKKVWQDDVFSSNVKRKSRKSVKTSGKLRVATGAGEGRRFGVMLPWEQLVWSVYLTDSFPWCVKTWDGAKCTQTQSFSLRRELRQPITVQTPQSVINLSGRYRSVATEKSGTWIP